jgi:hypothetical protein
MVQRTGLALILLLAFAVSILSAQQSPEFIPPKLISDAILQIPANWTQTYSPPEVMILVEVKTDSTATLLKILDGKNELQPVIEEKLPMLIFAPAFKNGFPLVTTLSLKLNIAQPASSSSKTVADSLKVPDKKEIMDWAKRRLSSENLQNGWSHGTYYRTNYFMMGLNSKPYIIHNNGFIEPSVVLDYGFIESPHIYYNSLTYQMITSFRNIGLESFGYAPQISLGERVEPPQSYVDPKIVPRVDVYAGLGDYEFNFAKARVMKSNLFGLNGVSTDIGFLVQNGWWQQTIADQTSTRILTSFPIKPLRTVMTVNMENYDQNIPSTVLLPGMQNGSLFRIGHKLQDISLRCRYDRFFFAWRTENETMQSSGIINKQEYKVGQLMLKSYLWLKHLNIQYAYQYNYQRDSKIAQQLYQYNKLPKHQGLIKLQNDHNFHYQSQFLITEDGLDKAEADIALYKPRIGLYGEYYNGKNNTQTIKGLYITEPNTYNPAAYSKFTLALKSFDWEYRYMDIDISAGGKRFVTTNHDDSLHKDITLESDNLYSELDLKYERAFGAYTAQLDQTLQWTQYKRGLYEQPELTGQTRLKLVKDMKYGNALSIGFNLTGHSDYIQADSRKLPIYGSMIADAWMGVKITDLFEFQLMMTNLNNNTIFGLSPHPRTIIGTIHWFYLN